MLGINQSEQLFNRFSLPFAEYLQELCDLTEPSFIDSDEFTAKSDSLGTEFFSADSSHIARLHSEIHSRHVCPIPSGSAVLRML